MHWWRPHWIGNLAWIVQRFPAPNVGMAICESTTRLSFDICECPSMPMLPVCNDVALQRLPSNCVVMSICVFPFFLVGLCLVNVPAKGMSTCEPFALCVSCFFLLKMIWTEEREQKKLETKGKLKIYHRNFKWQQINWRKVRIFTSKISKKTSNSMWFLVFC